MILRLPLLGYKYVDVFLHFIKLNISSSSLAHLQQSPQNLRRLHIETIFFSLLEMATNNPWSHLPPQDVQLNNVQPPLSAKDMLDMHIPDIEANDDDVPSQSSVTNEHFSSPDAITYNQREMFGNMGGYPNLNIQRKFWPLNTLQVGKITHEAQAVAAGRYYVLEPASFVLDGKIEGNEYCVEYPVISNVPHHTTGKIVQYDGYVDAVWRAPKTLKGDERPFAMCEFKRPGCMRPNWWKTRSDAPQSIKKMLKQAVKYHYAVGGKYFIFSDWRRFLFLEFGAATRERMVEYHVRGTHPPIVLGDNNPLRPVTPQLPTPQANGWPEFKANAYLCIESKNFKVLTFGIVWMAYREARRLNDLPVPP